MGPLLSWRKGPDAISALTQQPFLPPLPFFIGVGGAAGAAFALVADFVTADAAAAFLAMTLLLVHAGCGSRNPGGILTRSGGGV